MQWQCNGGKWPCIPRSSQREMPDMRSANESYLLPDQWASSVHPLRTARDDAEDNERRTQQIHGGKQKLTNPTRKWFEWSEAENAALVKYYPRGGTKIAAKHMPQNQEIERTLNAIGSRARRMKLRCKLRQPREKQAAIIAAIYGDGKPLHNKRAVLATGLSKSQVCYIAQQNGIVKKK